MKHAKLLSLLIAASLTVSTAPATVLASSGTESVDSTQEGLVGNAEDSAGSEDTGTSVGVDDDTAASAGEAGGSSVDAADAGAAGESSAESDNESAEEETISADGDEAASTSVAADAESSLSSAESVTSSAESAETTLVGAAASAADFYFTTDDGQTVNAWLRLYNGVN